MIIYHSTLIQGQYIYNIIYVIMMFSNYLDLLILFNMNTMFQCFYHTLIITLTFDVLLNIYNYFDFLLGKLHFYI